MKRTLRHKKPVNLGFLQVDRAQLMGLPKKPADIEKWIRSLGGRPVDAATRRRLKAAGHWGMPDE